MGWFAGIVVFLLIWWTMIFCVLPWGLQRDETGKPENLRLKKKILYTTLLSAALWLAIYGMVKADIIDFRAIAGAMTREDRLE